MTLRLRQSIDRISAITGRHVA